MQPITRSLLAIGLCILCMRVSGMARAEELVDVDQSTPKRAWISFRALCAAEDYQEAGALLVGDFGNKKTDWLAKRLCKVSNQLLVMASLPLPDEPEGSKRTDAMELVGRIEGGGGAEDVIQLRKEKQKSKQWGVLVPPVDTLERWHQLVQAQWSHKYLPKWMHRKGPWGLELWQWIALPTCVLVLWFLSWVGIRLVRLFVRPLFRKDREFWNDTLIKKISMPLQWMLWSLLAMSLIPLLYLDQEPRQYLTPFFNLVALWAGTGVGFRALALLAEQLKQSTWMRFRPTTVSLIPAGLRLARVLLVIIGVLLTLREFHYSLTSIIAGFGIGGLAVALAAQKTVEQVFGGVMLGIDQPMRVGDLIRVGDLQGTVESIGLRSTRIRTSDRSIITIPNGKLAEMNIENLTLRDKTRLQHMFRMDPTTPSEQVRGLLERIEDVLRSQARIWQSDLQVYLRTVADPSTDIEMIVWVLATETHEVAQVRQEILLQVLTYAEAQGIRWAVPDPRLAKK